METAGELPERFPGVILEPKPFSLAVHYRAVDPEAHSEVVEWVNERLHPISEKCTHGKMVVEFFTRGADKGEALQRYRERGYPLDYHELGKKGS